MVEFDSVFYGGGVSMNNEIEKNLWKIQKSTRTNFRSLVRVHNALRLKSRPYYKWHIFRFSSFTHLIVLFLAISGIGYYVINAYRGYANAADKIIASYNLVTPNTTNSRTVKASEALIAQISQITANQTLETISDKLGNIPQLSSESTQEAIKQEIEYNIAKDATLSSLIQVIENGDRLETNEVAKMASSLSDIGKDSVLSHINKSINEGNADLENIKNAINSNLEVSISNWQTVVSISNFPSDYPSSSTENAQENIGSTAFNRNQSFFDWASRHDYKKNINSGEILNPGLGIFSTIIEVEVPINHTYYLENIIFSSNNKKNSIYRIYYKENQSSPATLIDRVVFEKSETKQVEYLKKLSSGNKIEIIMEGVDKASGTSMISISYIDLPWSE